MKKFINRISDSFSESASKILQITCHLSRHCEKNVNFWFHSKKIWKQNGTMKKHFFVHFK